MSCGTVRPPAVFLRAGCKAARLRRWAAHALPPHVPSRNSKSRAEHEGTPSFPVRARRFSRCDRAVPVRRPVECPESARSQSPASSIHAIRQEKALHPCKAQLSLPPRVAPGDVLDPWRAVLILHSKEIVAGRLSGSLSLVGS